MPRGSNPVGFGPLVSLVTSLASLRAVSVAALLVSPVFAGCDATADPEGEGPVAAQSTPAAGATDAAPAPDAPRYDVRVEFPQHTPPGQEALAKVRVEPRSPWHMNTEFPVALRITAPSGVTVEVLKQRKDDAERFDDDGLVFALPFTPTSGGTKRIAGEVDFAVCGDAACAPETVPVDFTVEVGCDTGALC